MIEHQHTIDRIAQINGVVTGLALFPQLFKALISSDTIYGLSPVTFGIIFINSFVWIFYGIHRKTVPLVVASCLNTLASLVLTILSVMAYAG